MRWVFPSPSATNHRATIAAPALLAQLVEHLHGKEGVDGSSPSEGFTERPAKRLLELSQWETTVTRGHYLVFPRQAYRQVVFGLIKLIRTELTPSVPRRDLRIGAAHRNERKRGRWRRACAARRGQLWGEPVVRRRRST